MPRFSDLPVASALTADDYFPLLDDPAGSAATRRVAAATSADYFGKAIEQVLEYALSDESTSLTTGTAKLTVRMPWAFTLSEVRSSLTTASTSGLVTVDINEGGSSVLSTKLSIDANEKTSVTAATAAVISDTALANDAELTFDIDAAGTGAKGLKVKLIGVRAPAAVPPGDIAFVAASNTTYATRTTTTVNKPTGTADGDYILLGILTGAASEAPDPTPPAGFTLLTGFPSDATDGSFNVETRIYGKFASSEGASWAFTHTSCSSQGFALAYRNVNATTPIDVNSTIATGTGSTATATGLTTVTNKAMVVFYAHDWGTGSANLTAPTGSTPTFAERIDVAPLIYVADGLLTTAGATGSKSFTNNNTPSSSDTWAAALIALRPV